MEVLTVREARRLALVRAGLLPEPGAEALPRGARARALAVVRRFGYLQLDTVSIAGARSHTLVLLSRLPGMDPALGETLLRPGQPLFEYWGHEASWIPLELYPAFEFRRQDFRHHPWWGDIVGQHPGVADDLRRRIRDQGPLRSSDMEGRASSGWWDLSAAKKVAAALWSSGELAVRERNGFQRTWDLTERVIPAALRDKPLPRAQAMEQLVLKALGGHGWASTGTLAMTWRLRRRADVTAALARLAEQGAIVPCALALEGGRRVAGWIRPQDLALAATLARLRPNPARAVLLSPFDPVLWDRGRVQALFGFDQILEIFKPAHLRSYGYYCLPVLAGERLVARYDLKAERAQGRLRVLTCRFEGTGTARPATPGDGEAARRALQRYAETLGLRPTR